MTFDPKNRHSPEPTAIDKSPTTSTEPQPGSQSKPASASNAEEFPTVIKAKRIERKAKNEELPDQPQYRGNQIIPATIENLEVILLKEGYRVRYNRDKKRSEIDSPGHRPTADNRDNVGLIKIMSLAARYGMATGNIPAFVEVIADKNAYSPVEDWIRSKAWDGEDRLPAVYATVHAAPGYPDDLKQTLTRKWLLSAVAAALLPSNFRTRGVLVLQGEQGIHKTSWVRSLVSDPALRDECIKLDHHLDIGNKDSVLGAITHWIAEIGELESSFKKDVAQLKGFLTSPTDKVRRPYAKGESEYARRTVFVATVNDGRFLVDPTGNSRWWTISVVKLDSEHRIDMQQLYAQLAVAIDDGAEWWLTEEEEAQLALINEQHQTVSAVDELIRSHVDPARIDRTDNPYLTASALLRLLGIANPTNAQAKEAAATLRQLFGESKRVNGAARWRFPGTIAGDDKQSWLTQPAPPSEGGPPPPAVRCRPPADDARK